MLVNRAIPSDPSVRSSESLFLTESARQAGTASRRLLFCGRATAPPRIAQRMSMSPDALVLVRRRLMLIDGVPVRLATSYFPGDAPESAALAENRFIEGGLQGLFARHGRRFGSAEETLVARLPTSEETDLLSIGRQEPVVEIIRCSYDNLGAPVHALQTICAAGRHVFTIRQLPGDRIF